MSMQPCHNIQQPCPTIKESGGRISAEKKNKDSKRFKVLAVFLERTFAP